MRGEAKSVLLLSTLVTAALLLIAAFAILFTVAEFTNPPAAVGAREDVYERDDTCTTATTVTIHSFPVYIDSPSADPLQFVEAESVGSFYRLRPQKCPAGPGN